MFLFGGNKFDGIDNELYELDYKKNTWIHYPKADNVPYPRSTALIGYYNDFIYIFGGEISKNSDNYMPDDDLYAYSLKDQTWTIVQTTGTRPKTRYLGGSVVYNNYFYIFYGYNDELEADIDDFYRISLETLIWESVKINNQTSYARKGYGMVLNNDEIYIFGGWTELEPNNILIHGSLVIFT